MNTTAYVSMNLFPWQFQEAWLISSDSSCSSTLSSDCVLAFIFHCLTHHNYLVFGHFISFSFFLSLDCPLTTSRLCPSLSFSYSSVSLPIPPPHLCFSTGLKVTAELSYVLLEAMLSPGNYCKGQGTNLPVTAVLNSVWAAHTPVKKVEQTLQVPTAEKLDGQVGL